MPLGHKKRKECIKLCTFQQVSAGRRPQRKHRPVPRHRGSAQRSLASRALPPQCSSPRPRPNPCLVSKEGRTQYLWLQRSCTAGNPCVFSPDKKSVFVQETERNPGPEYRNRRFRTPDIWGMGGPAGRPTPWPGPRRPSRQVRPQSCEISLVEGHPAHCHRVSVKDPTVVV